MESLLHVEGSDDGMVGIGAALEVFIFFMLSRDDMALTSSINAD